ncbi:hypothetical protein NDU88_001221 [Pleurodeles waltl]|uniref:Uncharacterized protein n=1 Tax=Pleurodeles waltl TaxID=8319 RepID=A0AAV7WLU4_PLEWA|nr:hypothetical protein NDU88_001221 [Pleurodeles waltl]
MVNSLYSRTTEVIDKVGMIGGPRLRQLRSLGRGVGITLQGTRPALRKTRKKKREDGQRAVKTGRSEGGGPQKVEKKEKPKTPGERSKNEKLVRQKKVKEEPETKEGKSEGEKKTKEGQSEDEMQTRGE